MKKWKLNVSEPTVIFQGEEGDQGWGKHQFPNILYTKSGKIRVRWSYGRDYAGTREKEFFFRLSADGGKTWYEGNEDLKPVRRPMPNGKYYTTVKYFQAPYTKELQLERFTPACTWMDGRCKLYFMDDLRDDPLCNQYNMNGFTFVEYDPETDKYEEFESKLNWPNAPVVSFHTGFTTNPTYRFADYAGNVLVEEDGTMFFFIHAQGFDATADREHAVFENYEGENSVYVFESTDSARTWNFVSQVHATAAVRAKGCDYQNYASSDGYEGFNEPCLFKMPNGDHIMLMRTGMSRSLYVTYSTDRCRTWSEPEVFDGFGCLPQMLAFGCGATLASYGRPYLHLRLTSDPSGRVWDDPVHVYVSDDEPNYRNRSCFYTGLLPIDDYTCLLVHSDFLYPNENGVGVRSILVRTLSVTEEE